MSKVYSICLALIVVLGLSGVSAETEPEDVKEETIRVRLELKDGSSILGVPFAEKLSVSARYDWELDIPFETITSLAFPQDTTNAVLRLQNGDQLTVQVRNPSIKLESLLGALDIKMTSVVSMRVVTTQVVLAPELRKGLLAFYPFAVNEGNVCSDQSGKERDGKVVNAQWTPNGKTGGAMRIGPMVSYVVAPDDGLPVGNAPRSIAFWMRLDNTRSSGNAVAYGTHGSGPYNQACMLGMDWRLGRNSIAFSQWGAVNVASQKFEAGRWYHIVYTYNGEEHTFYIDGSQDNLAVREIGTAINTTSSGNLYMGAAGPDAGRSFDGWLDEVMIYDRALSAPEVRHLYERR